MKRNPMSPKKTSRPERARLVALMLSLAALEAPGTGMADGTVGIRNFAQLLPAMSAVTGVPQTNAQVQAYFKSAKSGLSLDGSSAGTTSALLLAAAAIGGVVCQQSVSAESALDKANPARVLFGGVDFTQDPSAAFLNVTVQIQVINAIAQRAWGRAPTATETQILVDDLNDTAAVFSGSGSSSLALNQILAFSLCAVFLSSPDFLRN